MGRQLRRVPLDFDWPLNSPWQGFVSPKWRSCPSDDCDNGSKLAAAWLGNITQLILMLSDSSRDRQLHPWLKNLPLTPHSPPKANAVELTAGLAGRSPGFLGHDAIDRWIATKAIIKAAGLPDDWGLCPVCKGTAIHPDDIDKSENWRPTDPPTGEGYQLWETVSEGSPITPVFSKPEDLAHWLVANDDSITSDTTFDGWMRFILGDGWAPSMIGDANGLRSGVSAIADRPATEASGR